MSETTTEQKDLNWIVEEQQKLGENNKSEYEDLPSMKFDENKVTSISIDFSAKPNSYDSTDDRGRKVFKAIIPVVYDSVKKLWWLNKANPIYRELLERGKANPVFSVKILRTGQQMKTRYVIVE